jgi:hypothetical protein
VFAAKRLEGQEVAGEYQRCGKDASSFRAADPLGFSSERVGHVPGKYRKFSPEFREGAARMVGGYLAPDRGCGAEPGINETSLGNWVPAYPEKHAGNEPRCCISRGGLGNTT